MRLNHWISLIFVVFAFVAIFYLAAGIFRILSFVAPVLLLATLIINYRIVLGYGKTIFNLIQRKPLLGIGAVVLTVLGFPIVIFVLFVMALMGRKFKNMQKEQEAKRLGEYIDYEEVEPDEEEMLELPEFDKEKSKNEYDEFF